jgi:hypothetical protein
MVAGFLWCLLGFSALRFPRWRCSFNELQTGPKHRKEKHPMTTNTEADPRPHALRWLTRRRALLASMLLLGPMLKMRWLQRAKRVGHS